jgi:hypothetical protein
MWRSPSRTVAASQRRTQTIRTYRTCAMRPASVWASECLPFCATRVTRTTLASVWPPSRGGVLMRPPNAYQVATAPTAPARTSPTTAAVTPLPSEPTTMSASGGTMMNGSKRRTTVPFVVWDKRGARTIIHTPSQKPTSPPNNAHTSTRAVEFLERRQSRSRSPGLPPRCRCRRGT